MMRLGPGAPAPALLLASFLALLTVVVLTASARAQTAFISNEKDNTVSMIDVKTLKVVDTLTVGQRPRGILLSPDFRRLYICTSDDDRVEIWDPVALTKIGELPSGLDPEQFALSPDGRHLYIANEDDDIVTVVNTETRQAIAQVDVGVEPEGMAVSPDGKIAINTSETTKMVHGIDTETFRLIDNTLVDQRPRHGEFSADGQRLWVSAEIGGTVAVIDVARREVIETIGFEIAGIPADRIQPVGIQLTSDGTRAFVSLGSANHVAIVDAQTFKVLDYVLVGRRVWHLGLTPDEKLLLSTNGVTGDVTVIDVERLTPIKSIKVGRYPWGGCDQTVSDGA